MVKVKLMDVSYVMCLRWCFSCVVLLCNVLMVMVCCLVSSLMDLVCCRIVVFSLVICVFGLGVVFFLWVGLVLVFLWFLNLLMVLFVCFRMVGSSDRIVLMVFGLRFMMCWCSLLKWELVVLCLDMVVFEVVGMFVRLVGMFCVGV